MNSSFEKISSFNIRLSLDADPVLRKKEYAKIISSILKYYNKCCDKYNLFVIENSFVITFKMLINKFYARQDANMVSIFLNEEELLIVKNSLQFVKTPALKAKLSDMITASINSLQEVKDMDWYFN